MRFRPALAAGALLPMLLLLGAATPVPEPADPGDALRRAVYADVFAGGDGLVHLADEFAAQLESLRALRDSRPAAEPAPELVAAAPEGTRALRSGGSLLVHAPAGAPFVLDTDLLPGPDLRGWWFDPRAGTAIDLGSVIRAPQVPFFPPVTGPADVGLDWVLVVDPAAAALPPPGG
jgi:hypothetical protein